MLNLPGLPCAPGSGLRARHFSQKDFMRESPLPHRPIAPSATGVASAAPETLVYADGRIPGISRVRRGKRFSYHLPCGQRIIDRLEIRRLAAIGRPPAYQRCYVHPAVIAAIKGRGVGCRAGPAAAADPVAATDGTRADRVSAGVGIAMNV
jgi:hypothetical protein